MTKTNPMTIAPPTSDEYDEYYHRYISLFDAPDFLAGFAEQADQLKQLLGSLPDETVSQLHAPYTWTLKQVVGHLIDCERIFSTRLLRIGVGDETPIPGIDQNDYVANLNYDSVSMHDLLDEFSQLRHANVRLAGRMTEDSLRRMGVASEKPVSARANLFILAGHVVYHVNIIQQRLGIDCRIQDA